MSPRQMSLSETELEVLKVLWTRGPSTAREANEVLQDQGRRWAYTTVLTLLHRLEAKGFIASDKSRMAYVFRAAVSREKLLRQRLTRLAADLCEGTSTPLVHALVAGQKFSPAEIEHFRQLLDELEPKKLSPKKNK
jgi:BlaI family penicillinase repressor